MVFCNMDILVFKQYTKKVTILILVDGFLQCCKYRLERNYIRSHNPYFSRWFSAIRENRPKKVHNSRHNPYFSRWFSAIRILKCQT